MKKLILLITALFLLASAQGQILRYSNYTAPAPPEGFIYPDILDDENMLGWYIASEDNVLITNGVIETWYDISGNNADFASGATESRRPTLVNGHKVYFDGSTDVQYEYFASEPQQPLFIYIVLIQESDGAGWQDEAFIIGRSSVHIKQQGTSPNIQATAGSTSDELAGPAIGDIGIIRCLFNGESSYLQVNENSPSTDVNFSTGVWGTSQIFLGASGTAAGFCNVSFLEIIIRSAADSETDRDIIYDYLVEKYL